MSTVITIEKVRERASIKRAIADAAAAKAAPSIVDHARTEWPKADARYRMTVLEHWADDARATHDGDVVIELLQAAIAREVRIKMGDAK